MAGQENYTVVNTLIKVKVDALVYPQADNLPIRKLTCLRNCRPRVLQTN